MSRALLRRGGVWAVLACALVAGIIGGGIALGATAGFSASPQNPQVGQTVTFDADSSCVAPVSCTWDFGDGAGASGPTTTHAYATANTFTATLSTVDSTDPASPTSETQSKQITVSPVPNVAPTVSISGPGTLGKRQSGHFTMSANDSDGTIAARAWSVDGGAFAAGGSSLDESFATVGPHTVRARVTDNDGASTTSNTISVTVTNQAPTVSVSGSGTLLTNENGSWTMSAADADGTIASRAWSVDGGAFISGSATLTRAFAANGLHTVRARVTDDDGASTTSNTISVTVNNRPPIVSSVTGPAVVQAGDPATFTAAASDPDGTVASYRWSADGGASVTDDATHAFTLGAGNHTISVFVTDNDGGTSAVKRAATLKVNAAPTVTITGPASNSLLANVQGTFTMNAADTDGMIATREWSVDGAAFAAGGAAKQIAFADPGAHTVRVRVTDSDGGVSKIFTFSLAVPNRPPTVDFSWTPTVVHKGDQVVFTSQAVDPDGKPLKKLEWDLDGDGSYSEGVFGDTATRTYPDTTTRSIGLRATDADGAVAEAHLTLVPGARPPKATFTVSPASPGVGVPVTFTSTATDADGTVAMLEWDLDGDNTFDATGNTATHAFTSAGVHRVGLRVTDNDGASDAAYVNVEVGGAVIVKPGTKKTSAKILKPFPIVRYAGRLTATGARISLFLVKAPKGSKIAVTCRRGCPRSKVARTARNVKLTSMRGTYRAGAILEIRVTKSKMIGKYTKIQIMKGKAPKRQDLCLWPTSKKPKKCPAGTSPGH